MQLSPYRILMRDIFDTLFRGTIKDACAYLIQTREHQQYCIVNYVYGANLTARGLFAKNPSPQAIHYYTALCDSDLLLPDGIGLQLFVFSYYLKHHRQKIWLPNLNGTDFLPYTLRILQEKYDLHLVLYGTTSDGIPRSARFLRAAWYNVVYYQDGFSPFARDTFQQAQEKVTYTSTKKPLWVLIQWRTTVTTPLQELRTLDNIEKIRQYKFIVFNQSGTFDHSVLGGTEQRAPHFIQFLKLEWLWRTCVNPKKWRRKLLATCALLPLFFQKIVLKKRE